jgi:hypothetical protein
LSRLDGNYVFAPGPLIVTANYSDPPVKLVFGEDTRRGNGVLGESWGEGAVDRTLALGQ